MNDTVINLVDAIKSGDALATEQAFNAAMAEKLGSKIEDMRQSVAANMFNQPEVAAEESVVEEEVELDEASKATDAGLQTRMNKDFTKSVATRYDGTRKQEAEGKKGLVKTAKIMKSRGTDVTDAKQKASDKNDYENEM